MHDSGSHGARPWPERPVSAANKSGNDTAATRPALAYPLGPYGASSRWRGGDGVVGWTSGTTSGTYSPISKSRCRSQPTL